MSEGTTEAAAPAQPETNGAVRFSTLDELRDRSRFQFHEQVLEVPEVQGKFLLRSLTVRERESLPTTQSLMEKDKDGNMTDAAMEASAITFAQIIATPKLTPEQWGEFLGDWPIEAFDKVTSAYRDLTGETKEEVTEARASFPGQEEQ